jgi:hypothetical protein
MRPVLPVLALLGLAACTSDRAALERIDGRLARIEERLAAMEEKPSIPSVWPAPPTILVPSTWNSADVTGIRVPTILQPPDWKAIIDDGGCVLPGRPSVQDMPPAPSIIIVPPGVVTPLPSPERTKEKAPEPVPSETPAPPR